MNEEIKDRLDRLLSLVESQEDRLGRIQRVIKIQELDQEIQTLLSARAQLTSTVEALSKTDVPGLKKELGASRERLERSQRAMSQESLRSLLKHGRTWIAVAVVAGIVSSLATTWYMKGWFEMWHQGELVEKHWSFKHREIFDRLGKAPQEELDAITAMTKCVESRYQAGEDPNKRSCLPSPPKTQPDKPKKSEKPRRGKSKRRSKKRN